ncbi:MBL fold metallo-hydrolase [Rhodococcus sp. UNC23MFCrub1.1]|uniref:MBL fold metallo-hydrolase n=1 Tax=Rhodococcus sp. UNC23MFCrub1.1 TaxID=1449068 RepID=UPI000489C4EB|nr:MBL fold metallo-hydrolase [Rhodococcus sp. UNC23MFCrub1.1]
MVSHGSYTFVGNATGLVSYGDITLLTDPNFLHAGERAYLGHGLFSTRRLDPAVSIDELPPLSAIVLSHMHGDHWDRRAQSGLDRSLPVFTTGHAASKLTRRGFEAATGLSTWESRRLRVGEQVVTITAMPGRHGPVWAQRLRVLPPVMGTMLEFGSAESDTVDLRVYVSGDTLMVDELREIPTRCPDIDTGVVHLGGTTLPFGQNPRWGAMVTMDGRQGTDAMQLVDPAQVLPVHVDDYGVFASPLSDFSREMRARGLGDRITYVGRGETVPLRR